MLVDLGTPSKVRVLKVSKDALVLLEAKLTNGLYILQGSTVTGATSGSFSKVNSEANRSRRMQLQHIKEKGSPVSDTLYVQSSAAMDSSTVGSFRSKQVGYGISESPFQKALWIKKSERSSGLFSTGST